MALRFESELPTAKEYWGLFQTTGWNGEYHATPQELIKALAHSWYCLAVYDDERLVGFGRIVTDQVLHAMIYDLIVDPGYQRQGLGSQILDRLIGKCADANIRDIQLFCARGKQAFYEKRGFVVRPTNAPGMQYQPFTSQPRPTAVVTTEGAETLALVNGTLIDGTGAPPLADAVVVIRNGRIVGVGARAAVLIPTGAQVIDVQGATILPGFFNTHVHRGYSEQNLQAWAQAGVTTVRDLGTSPAPDTFAARNALLKDPRNARLVAAGPMLTVPGGYPMVPWGMQGLVIASEKDAVAKVNQLLDDGADVIKIALESGSTFKRQIPVLSKAEAAAIVKIAHARGVRVSAHVTAAEDLERVLDAGVDDIAHMPYDHVSDELIARIVKADLYWIPTLELWQHVGVSDVPILDNLRRFVAAGGQVALGTDYAGYAAQFELGMPLSEMEAMQRAGMTPMQIILAGTKNAALVCGLDRELGALEAGKVADVLVVKGDPLQDIHALASVRLVIHNGAVIRQ